MEAEKTVKRIKTAAGRRQRSQARYLAVTGVLSAVSFVLMLVEFPIPIMPPFIKFDFSDLPALLGAFALGPVCGILTELIKNVLHVMVSGSFGVGELSNFLLGAVFVGTAGFVYRWKKTRKGAVIGSFIGAAMMALLSYPLNLLIIYPVYYQFMPESVILEAYQAILPSMKSVAQSLIVFNMPFTFVKGILNVLLTVLIYKKLSPIMKGVR